MNNAGFNAKVHSAINKALGFIAKSGIRLALRIVPSIMCTI